MVTIGVCVVDRGVVAQLCSSLFEQLAKDAAAKRLRFSLGSASRESELCHGHLLLLAAPLLLLLPACLPAGLFVRALGAAASSRTVVGFFGTALSLERLTSLAVAGGDMTSKIPMPEHWLAGSEQIAWRSNTSSLALLH